MENAAVDGFCVYCAGDEDSALDAIRGRACPTSPPPSPPRPTRRTDTSALTSALPPAASPSTSPPSATGGWPSSATPCCPTPRPDRCGWPAPADAPHPTTRARLAGFADAFAALGVDLVALTVLERRRQHPRRRSAAVASTLAGDAPPTAVLACSDVLALGVLDALAEAGRHLPHPVSVTGFDDIAEAAAAGLTTVRQPAEEKGRIAAELLLEPPADPAAGHVLLRTDLVLRTSAGPA